MPSVATSASNTCAAAASQPYLRQPQDHSGLRQLGPRGSAQHDGRLLWPASCLRCCLEIHYSLSSRIKRQHSVMK